LNHQYCLFEGEKDSYLKVVGEGFEEWMEKRLP